MTAPKTPTRIYLVRNTDTGEERLVRAPSAARALAHLVRTSYMAEVASQEQLVALLTAIEPVEIEDAMTSSRDDEGAATAEEVPAEPATAALWPEAA